MLFQWSKLETGSIRLVRFLPYSTPSSLYLALEHRSKYWDEAVRYTALSYVHGDRNERKPITLAGRSYVITANLHAALTAVYACGHGIDWFWVDQLCLNHQHMAEKNAQVAQMGAIYASADRVVAWLNPEDGSVASALTEAGSEVRNEQLTSQDQESDMRPGDSRIMPAVVSHSHWQRAWTRVEARRARKLEVMYGDHLIKAEVLSSLHDGTHDQNDNLGFLIRRSSNKDAISGSDKLAPSGVLKDIINEYSKYSSSNVLDRVFAMLNDLRLDKLSSERRPLIAYGSTAADLAYRLGSWYDDLAQLSNAGLTETSSGSRQEFCSYVAAALRLP